MTLIGGEHVNDDRAEIDEDPAAVAIPLGARDRESIRARGLGNRVGDRARLDFRAPRHNDERIGYDRAALEIDDRDVLAFFIVGGGMNGSQKIRQCESFPKSAR